MNLFKKTLRGKITGITLIIIAFLFLLVGLLQYTFMKEFLYNNKAESLHAEIRSWPPEPFLFRKEFPESIRQDNNIPLPERSIIVQPGMAVSVIERNGEQRIISDTNVENMPVITAREYEQIFEQLQQNHQKKYEVYSDTQGNDYLVVFRYTGRMNTQSVLQVSFELASLHKQLYTQLAIYAGVALFALLAGTILLLLGLRKALQPIHNMLQTVERTNAQNLTEQLPPMGLQELNQLALAYNNMLQRLEGSFDAERKTNERMRQFLADASHELRTPITSIHGFIEVLQRGAMHNANQLERSLKAMEQESHRMKSLVENLLQLAKLDQGGIEHRIEETEIISMRSLLTSLQLQLELMAGKRSVSFIFDRDEAYMIRGNRNALTQVILNIVNNAIQHTDPSDGTIEIELSQQGKQLRLSVHDNGVGIALEHQRHLFERFFRVDKSRTRAGGGAGLGLSITKSIVEAHGGDIGVSSILGKGTTFNLTFPASHSDR